MMSETASAETIDPRVLRDCCGKFATGVTVITTRTAEGTHGMTVSAFMSVSLDPPLVSISLNRQSKTLGKIREAGCYAVNILTREMKPHALHFAGSHDNTLTNLFEERYGLPTLRGAAAILVADVVREIEAGDHVLVLGHVRELDHAAYALPLLFHAGQFGDLAKGPTA
ncbi:flavin reductase family protein [Roseibium sp.]|uniref:flavin reductase family protein n=2 Tax=Roseibium sp. TaxID=1936156 RepID=UPI0025F756DB|nr:flavin reductase family protein [Roseibium sp.]